MNAPKLIADVSFTTEGIAVIGSLLVSLAAAIGLLFRTLVAQYIDDRNNWKQIATVAIEDLRKENDKRRAKEGKPPLPKAADVVPQHSSPVTKVQRKTAESQTGLAELVAIRLDMGLIPRTESSS